MDSLGIYWDACTCPRKNFTWHTKHINRLCIVIMAIPHFGVQLVCFIIKCSSTEMPWMPTLVLFVLIRRCRRSGTIWVRCMSLAIKSRTLSMRIVVPLSSHRPTLRSLNDYLCWNSPWPLVCRRRQQIPAHHNSPISSHLNNLTTWLQHTHKLGSWDKCSLTSPLPCRLTWVSHLPLHTDCK